MRRKVPPREKEKIQIQELHKIVHQAQDRGIPALSILKQYGVSNRAYYTQCKKHNLPTWKEKNQNAILIKKGMNPSRKGMSGGSLSLPNIDEDDYQEAIAKDIDVIKAKKKKSIKILYNQR